MPSTLCRIPTLMMLVVLALPALAATEPPPGDEKKTVEKVKVIVVSGDEGEVRRRRYVIHGEEGDLPPGAHGYHFFQGTARRGYLGVELLDLTPELRRHFGTPEDAGVMVARVEPDSPAAEAGLAVGDLLTAVGGEPVATSRDVRRAIRDLEEGTAVSLAVRRGSRTLDLTATVVERERAEIDVRRLLRRSGEPGGPGGFVYEIDEEAVEGALRDVERVLPSPEIAGRLRSLRHLEGDLARRIEELEKRIAELERDLARERQR